MLLPRERSREWAGGLQAALEIAQEAAASTAGQCRRDANGDKCVMSAVGVKEHNGGICEQWIHKTEDMVPIGRMPYILYILISQKPDRSFSERFYCCDF